MTMKFLLVFLFSILFTTSVNAYELLMFHNKYCGYCVAFMREVAIDYEYKDIPLVIIDTHNQPDWFKKAYAEGHIKKIRGTPTFIVWNGKEELVRIVGYGDKESFYKRLDEIIKQIIEE